MPLLEVEAWLEGTTPMLQHRATEEALSGKTRRNTHSEEEDPRTIAERGVYRVGQQLAFPGAAIARMLREAGGAHKAKGSRKSLKYLVPAAVLVLDDLCLLYLADRKSALVDYEVDSRPVTIPATKGRVMRHRARFNEWAARVHLRINDDILDEQTIRRLMLEGLQQIGLGDFRPEKGGPFGVSDLVAWEMTTAQPRRSVAQERNGRRRDAA